MPQAVDFSRIPAIDVGDLVRGGPGRFAVAQRLAETCRESGFFYALGHGVDEGLQARLHGLALRFFAQDLDTKLRIRMALGGRAWRGYFPVGDELTSGKPDQKEGLYFGAELPADDPRVRAGTPLHGANLFPDEPRELRAAVLEYMAALERLGHRLVAGLALGLGLHESYFAERYTAEPFVLFRIFNYPPPATRSCGASASTPTTACSRSCSRTTPAASRCARARAGCRLRRSRARSSATSATCSTA